jgi:hypothetical protein
MKNLRIFLAIILTFVLPLPAFAQQQKPPSQSRPAAPQTRPAQPGYDLNKDTQRPPNGAPARPPVNNPGYRPAPPNNTRPAPPPPNNTRPAPPPNYRPPNNAPPAYRPPNPSYRPPNYRPPRPPVVVVNPIYRGHPAWYWNRGVAWYPAPAYWGGGFWGTLAIAATSAAVFGYIVGSSGAQYVSYQVQPNSPGAQLLQAYGLTQTPCGPPNLVVIYGPDNSVICAYPNNLVSAGTYSVDPSTLTISSY